MKLKYRKEYGVNRQYSLIRKEEEALANKGKDFVGSELYRLLVEVSLLQATEYALHKELPKLNSLIWIWVQMEPERVLSNLRILMARQNIMTINKLAKKARLNASFLGRLFHLDDPVGVAGWNVSQVFKLAAALDARPELMLMADLKRAVSDEVVNWQVA